MSQPQVDREEGLRERHKREKLARIVAAARELFSTKGYSETTLRDVAKIAEVATGTIFLYVESKEELLSIVFERELAPAVERGLATLPAADVEQQLLHMFKAVADLHARNTELSLAFVREMTFRKKPPIEGDGYMHTWHTAIYRLVEAAQTRGEIEAAWSSRTVGFAALRLFLMTQAYWLSGRWGQADMEADLKTSLALLLRGLRPRDEHVAAG